MVSAVLRQLEPTCWRMSRWRVIASWHFGPWACWAVSSRTHSANQPSAGCPGPTRGPLDHAGTAPRPDAAAPCQLEPTCWRMSRWRVIASW